MICAEFNNDVAISVPKSTVMMMTPTAVGAVYYYNDDMICYFTLALNSCFIFRFLNLFAGHTIPCLGV